MENEWKWDWEQNTLVSELIQGLQVARKLKEDLRTPCSEETKDLLVQRILSSYEKALLILRWNASSSKHLLPLGAQPGLLPDSPISVNGSPLRDDVDGDFRDHPHLKPDSKKRSILL